MNADIAAIRRLKALCLTYHVLVGVVGIGSLPALITSFEATFHLSHARMGAISGLAVIGAGIGSFLGGFLFDRFGPRLPLTGAAALFVLAALGIWRAPSPAALTIGLFFFQAAHGLGSTVNAFFGRLHPLPERTRALNQLQGFLGIGFLLAPLAVTFSIQQMGQWRPVFVASAALFAWCGGLFYRWLGRAVAWPAGASPPPASLRASGKYLLDARLMLGLLGFVFVTGCEVIIMTWVPAYAEIEAGFPKAVALLSLTAAMIGYTAIRLFLGTRHRGATPRFIAASAALTLVSIVLMMSADSAAALYVSSGMAGFAIGAFWPSLAASIFAYIEGGHGVVGGMFNTVSVVGISAMVSLSGWLADAYSLRSVLLLAPLCAAIYAAIYYAFARLAQRRRRAAPAA